MALPFRAVAFDLGGVVVDVDHQAAAHQLAVSLKDWQTALFTGDAHDALSTGRLAADAYLQHAAHALARPVEQVTAAWARVVTVWPGAAALLDAVRARGLRVLIWSNTDPVHAEVIARTLPVVTQARGLSFRLGAMKPDAAFFERALEPTLAFGDVLFLDDRDDNVAAAQTLGIHARKTVGGLEHTRAALGHALGLDPRELM